MLKNSKNLLKYLFSNEGYETTMEKASDIHYNIFIALACFIVYIVLSSVLNILGGGWINAYKAIILNFLLLFHLTKPEILSAVAITAPFVNNKNAAKGEKQSFVEKIRLLSENVIVAAEAYKKIACHLLLIASVTDLALSVIPIKSNPNIVVIIILCGMVAIYADVVWEWETKIFRKSTYLLLVIAVILNVALLVPEPLYRYLFDWAPSDISVKMMEKKIENAENRGVLIKGIKAIWDAGNDAAEKLRLEKEIERLKASIAQKATEAESGNEGGNENTLTLQYLRTLHPFNGKGMGTTMYTAEFGTDYKKGDLLVVSCSKDSLVWLDGEGGGWLHPDPDGRKKITTMTHGPGHILMQVPKGKNANIEVWRYLPL